MSGAKIIEGLHQAVEYELREHIAILEKQIASNASAGLIEAAELAEKEARAGWAVGSLRDFAIKLRSRAADRSRK